VAIATAGNTAGGMTSYALGFMASGRLARYIAVASLA
jgi:membrane protein YqaA with SNARE-associated domain